MPEIYFLWHNITTQQLSFDQCFHGLFPAPPPLYSLLLLTGLCFLSVIWSTFLADSKHMVRCRFFNLFWISLHLFITSTFNVIINMVGLSLQLVICFLCLLFYSLFSLFFFCLLEKFIIFMILLYLPFDLLATTICVILGCTLESIMYIFNVSQSIVKR